jgi:hypothetical protein
MNKKTVINLLIRLHEEGKKISFGQVLALHTFAVAIFLIILSFQSLSAKEENKLTRFSLGIVSSAFTVCSAYLINKNKDKFDF